MNVFSKHRKVIFLTATFLMLATIACNIINLARTTASQVQGQPKIYPTVEFQVERNPSPKVTTTELQELTAANNAFAFDLYQAIRSGEGNLFYSPHSILTALAMTYAGARGNTEQQMSETLHYALPQNRLHSAFNALDLSLTSTDNFTLTIANSLWGQEGYAFRSEFLETLAANYGGGLRLIDFVDEQSREEGRSAINQWVDQTTGGKIDELIAKGILTADTRLVLANAIYFKADWERPFLNGTKNDDFILLDGSTVTVSMMSVRAGLPYTEDPTYQAVELPYKGKRMSMLVLLPGEGQFADVEASLSSQFLDDVLNNLHTTDVKLYMPKFEYDADLTLAKMLAQMGMPDAFTPRVADLSGMDGTRELYIAHVIHKAFVAVDEIGTEAAAATGVVVGAESAPIPVKVNRPFIFLIRDNENEAVLFVGRVLNPLEK